MNKTQMNIHLIATGGSAMHNLAIALSEKGYLITGSDDEIFEPAKSRLARKGLLPPQMGWFPEKITPRLDAVILGMHAREDNPELIRAKELGLKIYSYPEYLFEQCREKLRVVVGGSHGKTSITAMIMHVLRSLNIDFDYMVGAQLEQFDTMVRLSEQAPVAIFEGDEYLASPLDPRPKFHLYHPHIAILSGIAWDHINVFPTFDDYVRQFEVYVQLIEKGGTLIYFAGDPEVKRIAEGSRSDLLLKPYLAHPSVTEQGITRLITPEAQTPLKIFGEHNLQNISAAMETCALLGVEKPEFYKAIASFGGAAKRLQSLGKTDVREVFLDFAHSPSKLKATISAVKAQFPERKLTACLELHTFSSLNDSFLKEYHHCMNEADRAIVYYNPETIRHKKLAPLNNALITDAFGRNDLEIFTDSAALAASISTSSEAKQNLLIMTSGNLNGTDLNKLTNDFVQHG